jgi:exodeoxyribonuclease VII large subunit
VLRNLPDQPEVGSRVVARVKPSFWLKAGRLSMNATDLRPVGLGDLLARLERLRRQLADEGLFNAERKRTLPFLPQRIGLVTGRDSDAEKDVLRNASLRWPEVAFEVRHAAVQGAHCVTEVVAALQELDADPHVDLIIIARGGGSLEDLLGFSDERMIRAVAAATTPVVSAIGHEADRPILDDVADLRASTPTDAAKRVVPDVGEERAGIADARQRLRSGLARLLDRTAQELKTIRTRPVLQDPYGMITVRQEDLTRLHERSDYAIRQHVSRATDQIEHLRARVRSLSPQQTLDRGYAVVQTHDGSVLRAPADAPEGTEVTARLSQGLLALVSHGELPDPLAHEPSHHQTASD